VLGRPKNKIDIYIAGRFIAKPLHLPARSRFGEGRAATSIRFATHFSSIWQKSPQVILHVSHKTFKNPLGKVWKHTQLPPNVTLKIIHPDKRD